MGALIRHIWAYVAYNIWSICVFLVLHSTALYEFGIINAYNTASTAFLCARRKDSRPRYNQCIVYEFGPLDGYGLLSGTDKFADQVHKHPPS